MLRQWLLVKLTRQRLRAFLEIHQTEQRVLDVGASANTLTHLFPQVLRGDIRLVPENELVYDAHQLPFADAQFPIILCTEVLEHCVEPHTVINEFWRVLAPGGKLILTTRFIFPIHDAPGDYFRFTQYGLQYLCRRYERVTVQPEALTVETLGILFHRMLLQAKWKVPGAKILLGLTAKLLIASQRLIKQEYGDISHTTSVSPIMASGYYVVAYKPLDPAT